MNLAKCLIESQRCLIVTLVSLACSLLLFFQSQNILDTLRHCFKAFLSLTIIVINLEQENKQNNWQAEGEKKLADQTSPTESHPAVRIGEKQRDGHKLPISWFEIKICAGRNKIQRLINFYFWEITIPRLFQLSVIISYVLRIFECREIFYLFR